MHPVGQSWIEGHKNAVEGGGGVGGDDRAESTLSSAAQCQACHGTDYRGTVLSRALGDRTIDAFGTKDFWKGYQIGCYTCHNGPGDDHENPNNPPTVADASTSSWMAHSVSTTVQAGDADGDSLVLRIVSQPRHGRAGMDGTTLTYVSDPGFVGQDTVTFAAGDGQADSNLGTLSVQVTFFEDVPTGFWAFRHIATLFDAGVTSGCSADPALYCPYDMAARGQMAVFLLASKDGAGYTPPPAAGMFDDVPVSSPFAPWIEELARRGITKGCNADPPLYCPNDAVTRDQMAVFLVTTFDLTGN